MCNLIDILLSDPARGNTVHYALAKAICDFLTSLLALKQGSESLLDCVVFAEILQTDDNYLQHL